MCLEEGNVIIKPDHGIAYVFAEGQRIGVFFNAVSSLKLDNWIAVKAGQQNFKIPGGEKDIPGVVVKLVNSFNQEVK